jgi:hypothetical protein
MKCSCHLFFNHHGMPAKFSDSNSSVSVPHGTNLYSLLLTSALTAHWFPHWLTNSGSDSYLTNCIQLGWFAYIVPARSERTRRKHRLRHRSIVASRTTSSSPRHLIGPLAAAQQKTVSYRRAIATDVTRACADKKEILPQDCCVILLGYRVTAVAQCLEQIRHNIVDPPFTSLKFWVTSLRWAATTSLQFLSNIQLKFLCYMIR